MKVSIWQQFSSNNSSTFTVAGRFETAEQAQKAQREIMNLLTAIAHWYNQPENAAVRKKIGPPTGLRGYPLTPTEDEYSKKYNIDWGDPIDWVTNERGISEAVQLLDTTIFVQNGYPLRDSTMPCHPIDALLERMGAKIWCNINRGIETTLTVTAPDTATKNDLLKELTVTSLTINNEKIFFGELAVKDNELTFHQLSSSNLIELISYLRDKKFDIVHYEFQ
jgi:hypothetical protein